NDEKLRRALALSIDRQAFNSIISERTANIGGVMMAGPEGNWGMPADVVASLPGYGGSVEANRAEARKIMESLGYTKDKPLKLKVATRNVPLYRDPAVILVDQLKSVNVDAELDAVDASIWFGKVARGDYAVGLNTTAGAIDDPDQQLYENYACNSERNYTKYCNPEVEKMIEAQSSEPDQEKRKKMVWDVERLLAKDVARPIIIQGNSGICWHPTVKNFTMHKNGIYNDWRFDDLWLDK
ncbi:MAG: ABC transporter substrate-binding protein, partial [Alphaproteobacteria bacterium]